MKDIFCFPAMMIKRRFDSTLRQQKSRICLFLSQRPQAEAEAEAEAWFNLASARSTSVAASASVLRFQLSLKKWGNCESRGSPKSTSLSHLDLRSSRPSNDPNNVLSSGSWLSIQGSDRSGSNYMLEADRATGSTNLLAHMSCVCVHIICRQLNSFFFFSTHQSRLLINTP